MRVKNSTGISLEFKPWTTDLEPTRYRITKLQIYEELGGEIPRGKMGLEHDGSQEALQLITEQNTGIIKLEDEKDGGLVYEIPIYITKKSSLYNILDIEFVCTQDKKFYANPISESYPTIKDAIQTVFPGKQDIRIEPDGAVDGIPESQNGETSYEFCKRMCYSYKANSVFAFGWEGLLIKELKSNNNEGAEDDIIEIKGGLMQLTKPYQLNYNKYLNHLPYDPWLGTQDDDILPTTKENYEDVMPKNVGVIMDYNQYGIVGKNYLGHIQNLMQNQRIMNSNLYTDFQLKATDMPKYKLGDVVSYKYPDEEEMKLYPFKTFLVKSNELFWTSDDSDGEVDWNGLRFSWTSKLVGLERGDWADEEQPQEIK